mmetsp:Transcript_13823/g.18114  ORF Transcript_13823/g.18114 Transcript_13823/m.18114 type:complete len:82 (+) Transcript_13823:140-385(+)
MKKPIATILNDTPIKCSHKRMNQHGLHWFLFPTSQQRNTKISRKMFVSDSATGVLYENETLGQRDSERGQVLAKKSLQSRE